jgi:hypothetical protein
MTGYAIKTHAPPCEVVDVDHLDAMQVVLAARQAATLASMNEPEQRERWAKRFEALIEELRVGVLLMRTERAKPADDIPNFLRADTDSPEFDERYLKAAKSAAFHD